MAFDQVDKDILVSIIAGSLLLFFLCAFIVAFSALYIRKRKQHKAEKEQLQTHFSQVLLQSQLEIKEQTLQRIAFELHDNLGQVASLIKINLNTLQTHDKEKMRLQIEDTKELVRQLITDLKSLSISLNSDRVAQFGIFRSIENEVERLNKTGQFTATLHQEGRIPELDANTATILFRMTQEIINNIVKHSAAKRIAIALKATENLFTLVYTDDGVGFNRDEQLSGGGSGLVNLQTRAKLINAQLTIQSKPEEGTTISIEFSI
ncbi:sensor histidine kinase [Chryseolinea soli]|uniref:Sensor histidine kinase n=1 Tax=Chryseolinea soli TaxID=2321403 RepID=A0A385SMV3_9BACT|nr:ATP-binding protein [Chryseolinea soli]AYB32182.1 sensor histidine kinase [Chryseolinea soli]